MGMSMGGSSGMPYATYNSNKKAVSYLDLYFYKQHAYVLVEYNELLPPFYNTLAVDTEISMLFAQQLARAFTIFDVVVTDYGKITLRYTHRAYYDIVIKQLEYVFKFTVDAADVVDNEDKDRTSCRMYKEISTVTQCNYLKYSLQQYTYPEEEYLINTIADITTNETKL